MANFLQEIETELGMIKVDVNTVIAKIVAGVGIVQNEVKAFFQWWDDHSSEIEAGLTAAAPMISEVGNLATTVATGNPAAGQVVSAAILGVNKAFSIAEAAVTTMNAADSALQKSAAAGNGALVNDTSALVAAVQTSTNASSSVTNITNAALIAAKMIQNVSTPMPTIAPATPPAGV